jgi:hypothetical protein
MLTDRRDRNAVHANHGRVDQFLDHHPNPVAAQTAGLGGFVAVGMDGVDAADVQPRIDLR